MNTVNNPLVDVYLAELERELEGLPNAVVRDILDGVREELAGLDADQAEVIIEQLGDPAFIAAEARAAAEPLSLSPQREPRGYVFLTAMIVALGGVIIPVVGWVVGVVMMWLSTSWRTWEKWVATLTPLLVLIAGYVATLIAKLAARPAEGDGDLHGPRFENFFPSTNPFQAAYFEFRIDAIVLSSHPTSSLGCGCCGAVCGNRMRAVPQQERPRSAVVSRSLVRSPSATSSRQPFSLP